LAFFFLFFLHGFSIGNGQQGISYNVLRINEVLKGVAQMFQVSSKPDTPFKILFNPLLNAAAVYHYKLHSDNCTKGLIFFFFEGGFSFFFKNN
jgi:hypothetical protein